MLRYMISPIIGAGTMSNSYRASVSDVSGINSSVIIPTHSSGPNIGKPKFNFALCLVATPNVGIIAAVTNAFVFPDYPLDGRMDGMETNTRTAFVQSVEAYNLDGNGLHFDASHDDADSYRDVVNAIAQQLEPVFNVNNFTVTEVS